MSADALHSLTPRERDCLRLLRQGLLTPQVASALGISVATLNKHLLSARRKLGVSRTAHALLLCLSDGLASESPRWRTASADLDGSPSVCDFAGALETCATFHEAWATLRDYVSRLGVTRLVTCLGAEPAAQLTNGGGCAIATSLPDHVMQLYWEMTSRNAGPTIYHAIGAQRTGLFFDNERVLHAGDEIPQPAAAFGQALLDGNMRFMLHQPERDSLTGAPLVHEFSVDPRAVCDFRRGLDGNPRETLQAIASAFWSAVQDKRLLRPIAGLSRRQIEALTLSARGFTIEESAGQMNVSCRSMERTLAGARKRLGARTTPAAVYRAMVYRALA